MTDLKTEAAARVLALRFGALVLADLTDWADAIIAAEEDFDSRLIDVSLANSNAQAISALNAIGRMADKPSVAARVCSFLHRSLRSDRGDYQKVAKALFDMAMDDFLPDSEQDGKMWGFWDALDLALEGSHGDPDAIKAEMLEFLSEVMA